MNWARLILSSVAGLVTYFICGGIVTGIFLKKEIMPYTAVYRPVDQIMKLFPFGILTTFLAIVVLTVLYAYSNNPNAGWIGGARFGALVGLFMMFAHVAHNYVNLNIGLKLALELAIAEFVQWILVATVIGALYKTASGKGG